MRLQLHGASRAWQTRLALREVSLSVASGERVAVIGPSGSGKSTLLRLMSGALAATGGRVTAEGVDLASMSPRALRCHRGRCGIVEQQGMLVGQLDVHRNVVAGYLPAWSWWRAAAAMVLPLQRGEVAELLTALGIAQHQWDRLATLSGGQQQRVAIARALVRAPRLLLADEPTAALDPTTAAEALDLIARAADRTGATLLVATHAVEAVKPRVKRIIGLREGRVMIDAPAHAVNNRDLDALYLGSRERR